MPRAEVTLPGETSSVPTARRFVDSLLTSWGLPDLAWPAALCVSELSGNCALHARTDFTIGVEVEDDVVRIEVRDGSPRVPSQRAYDTGATTGRGMRLVAEYATRWGVEATTTGKTVWVVLDARAPLGVPQFEDEDVADLLRAVVAEPDERAGDSRAAALPLAA